MSTTSTTAAGHDQVRTAGAADGISTPANPDFPDGVSSSTPWGRLDAWANRSESGERYLSSGQFLADLRALLTPTRPRHGSELDALLRDAETAPKVAQQLRDWSCRVRHRWSRDLLQRAAGLLTRLATAPAALTRQLAEAERARDAAETKYAAAEFWNRVVYPEGATAEQVQAELEDYRVIMRNVGEVYMHITGGRISKPNTLAEAVIGEADAQLSRDVEEAVREALDPREVCRCGHEKGSHYQRGWHEGLPDIPSPCVACNCNEYVPAARASDDTARLADAIWRALEALAYAMSEVQLDADVAREACAAIEAAPRHRALDEVAELLRDGLATSGPLVAIDVRAYTRRLGDLRAARLAAPIAAEVPRA